MGANTSQVSDLSESQSIRTLIGPDAISENEPFWNQLISFTFSSPNSSADAKLLEEAVVPLAKTLIQNNPRSGNFGALVRVFLSRTKELKISTECQDQLFIWQAHNALFLVRCLLKVFIREMNADELRLQFSYQERAPGTYDSGCEDLLEELVCNLVHLIVEVPLLDITYNILFEAVTTLLILLSYQLFHKEILREGLIYGYLTRERCLSLTSRLVKTLLYNFIRQENYPPAAQVFQTQSDGGGLLYGLASGVASGLWSVFTLGGVGSRPGAEQEQNPLPLSNQSLLLLLILANLTDGVDCPNPYRQAITCFKNTQDSSSFPSPQPHSFQINFNSLYTALCEQQKSDQVTLLLYTLLHQNSNMRTYILSRTDMENLVLPILEILYHVEERNSHHVYMALIILLILTEDDTFNRSIHEVTLKNISWYTERVLTEISLGSLLILVVIRTIQFNMTRTRDKYLHTNCLAALANMSAQFRNLHQYAAQRIIRQPTYQSVSHIPQKRVCVSKLLLGESFCVHVESERWATVVEHNTMMFSSPTSDLIGRSNPVYMQDLKGVHDRVQLRLCLIAAIVCNSWNLVLNPWHGSLIHERLFYVFFTIPSAPGIPQELTTTVDLYSRIIKRAFNVLSVVRIQSVLRGSDVMFLKQKLEGGGLKALMR
ncbi:Dymeclin [Triplophysa tibetana]|uniref:Dymeclin n=1 Tax=Triplophysa tibetana TaxID=1572043 RepID=A0A5A9PCU2_9TELE|nr:Dymeclin [Triplophysa tibetana]